MHRFDVKYTFDNYSEYYKYLLVKQHLLRDIIISLAFLGLGAYFFFTAKEENYIIPVLSIVIAIMISTRGVTMLPLVKRQLRKRQAEIDRTHVEIVFDDNEILYRNLTIKEEAPVDVEKTNETEENKETTNENEENKEAVNENEFRLQYANFMVVRETKGLFLFYLDRQTVIIIPKETYLNGDDFAEFKEMILSKVPANRVKFHK